MLPELVGLILREFKSRTEDNISLCVSPSSGSYIPSTPTSMIFLMPWGVGVNTDTPLMDGNQQSFILCMVPHCLHRDGRISSDVAGKFCAPPGDRRGCGKLLCSGPRGSGKNRRREARHLGSVGNMGVNFYRSFQFCGKTWRTN